MIHEVRHDLILTRTLYIYAKWKCDNTSKVEILFALVAKHWWRRRQSRHHLMCTSRWWTHDDAKVFFTSFSSVFVFINTYNSKTANSSTINWFSFSLSLSLSAYPFNFCFLVFYFFYLCLWSFFYSIFIIVYMIFGVGFPAYLSNHNLS